MTQIQLPKVEEFVKQLNEEELLYMNQLIVSRLKVLSQMKSVITMSQFNQGQRVRFDGPDGVERRGEITRLNKKTANITTDDGHKWKVAPTLLR